jgi:hypothetical protein
MSSGDTAKVGVEIAKEELMRRGAAVTRDTSTRGRNYLRVSPPDKSARRVYVKSRGAGTWQTSIEKGERRTPERDPIEFWLFVDLTTQPPGFLVAPAWWVENDIYETHQEYLAKHGGRRRDTPTATHHAIPVDRIEQWRNRWDLLGLS